MVPGGFSCLYAPFVMMYTMRQVDARRCKMKIKVKVDSNLKIKNVFEPPLELELKDDEHTLKDVLGQLAEKYPYLRFIEKGEMGDDLRHLYVNGQSHFSFSEGLKKELTEGDTVLVEAYMDPLAGG